MKSFYNPGSWMAVACLFFFLPACRKAAEILKVDPDAVGQFCRIDTFTFGNPALPSEQTSVSYNSAGDPEAILPNPVSSDPEFNAIYFRYDRFGRLRDVIFVYPGGTNIAAIDIWQRFSYPRPGLVIDSFLNYDGPGVPLGPSFTLPANPPPYVTATIRGYEQDKQGRTVRRWIASPNFVGPPQPVDTITIAYDRIGNQIRPGIGYDDKINIYRTNKVWQLLFQDYSTNNPVIFSTEFPISVITAYNRWGLPKAYMDNEGEHMGDIFFYGYGSVQVSYSCDGSSEGGSGKE